MHFLGFYSLSAALAIAGVCGACAGSPAASAHDTAPCYWVWDANNGAWVPSASTVLNTPPSRVDNGYWSAFYWNRVYDQPAGYYVDAQFPTEGTAAGEGYGYYGPGTDVAYSSNADLGAGGEYRADYAAASAGDYGSYGDSAYYRRNLIADLYAAHRPRREHHAANRHEQDNWRDRPSGQTNAGPAPIDNRYDANRVDRGYPIHVAHEDHGYNGHDRHMFEDHRPVKPVATGYQVHGAKERDHEPPRHE